MAVGKAEVEVRAVCLAEKDRGDGTKVEARALLLKGCCVKFPGVSVPQVLEAEVVCSHAVYEGLEWDHCCCWCLLRLLIAAMSLGRSPCIKVEGLCGVRGL